MAKTNTWSTCRTNSTKTPNLYNNNIREKKCREFTTTKLWLNLQELLRYRKLLNRLRKSE